MFNLENLDSVTEKFCNEVVSCTYLGTPYRLNELKNTVSFNGQLFTPHFYILKNGRKVTRHFKGEKSTNFTYSQAMQYNEVVKGEVCFNGYQVDNHNLLIKEL